MKRDYLDINSKNLTDYDAYRVESKSKDKYTGIKLSLKSYQAISCIWLFFQIC